MICSTSSPRFCCPPSFAQARQKPTTAAREAGWDFSYFRIFAASENPRDPLGQRERRRTPHTERHNILLLLGLPLLRHPACCHSFLFIHTLSPPPPPRPVVLALSSSPHRAWLVGCGGGTSRVLLFVLLLWPTSGLSCHCSRCGISLAFSLTASTEPSRASPAPSLASHAQRAHAARSHTQRRTPWWASTFRITSQSATSCRRCPCTFTASS